MGHGTLARLLGAEAAIGGVLLALAGSDWPPPRGFGLAVAASLGLGLAVWGLVPVVLRRAERQGSLPALVVAAAGGAGYLVLVAAALMLLSTGESSGPDPTTGERLAFVVVAACLGWLGGAAVGAVAVLADRSRPRQALLLVLVLPAVVIALAAVVVLLR